MLSLKEAKKLRVDTAQKLNFRDALGRVCGAVLNFINSGVSNQKFPFLLILNSRP